MAKNRTRGGRREGAGRKPLHPKTAHRPWPVSLALTPHLIDQLDDLAAALGKSRSELARQLIKSGITDLTHAG